MRKLQITIATIVLGVAACGESGDVPPAASPAVVLASDVLESEANFKVGDVYLYIPRDKWHPPFEGIRESRGLGHVACWSVADRTLGECKGALNQVKINMRPGRTSDGAPIPMTEVLAASITNHTGPFSVEGTVINEYRTRHGAANVFTFQAADDLRISRCQIKAWCTVRAGEQHGLDIRYDFKVDLISDWPAIDVEVISLVASLIVEEKNLVPES